MLNGRVEHTPTMAGYERATTNKSHNPLSCNQARAGPVPRANQIDPNTQQHTVRPLFEPHTANLRQLIAYTIKKGLFILMRSWHQTILLYKHKVRLKNELCQASTMRRNAFNPDTHCTSSPVLIIRTIN